MGPRFPAFGAALWQRRLAGERPRAVALLVGGSWRLPEWWPPQLPRVAVRAAPWHEPTAPHHDWRVIAGCNVFAFDQRSDAERVTGPDGWDSWLWLLAAVQAFAHGVAMFSETLQLIDPRDRKKAAPVIDPRDRFASERWLGIYAFLHVRYEGTRRVWPPWWPYGEELRGVGP